MQIQCDDATAARLLAAIRDEVVKAGASLHPDLVIHQRGPDMWATCATPAQVQPLLRIPAQVLLPMDPIHWAPGLDLTPSQGLEQLTGRQRRLLEWMLALYETTGKIEYIRPRLPALALTDQPWLVAYLARAWPGWGKRQTALTATQAFIKTRALGITDKADGVRRRWLMPLIDVFNHHPAGAKFLTQGGGVAIAANRPDGTHECFARYGFRDAMSLLLNYGYVDSRPGFVQSVACEVGLDGHGSLRIEGQHGGKRTDLPSLNVRPDGEVAISHFNLDPRTMARDLALLGLLLRRQAPGMTRTVQEERAMAVYEAIRAANVNHYLGLLDLLRRGEPAIEVAIIAGMLAEVADHQLAVLNKIRGSA